MHPFNILRISKERIFIGAAVAIHKLPVFNTYLRQISGDKMKDLLQPTLSLAHFPYRFRSFLGISLAFALVLCFSTAPAFAADVTLAWNPNSEEDLAGYRIYYGTASGDYDHALELGNQTEYTVADLVEGLLYYFSATAYDLSGNESDYSNEVAYAPSCGYSITPTSQSFGYSGGTGVVTVTAEPGCSWAAVSNASWLIITSNSNGSGNGTIHYTVSANSETFGKTGTLTIADRTLTVTQQGTVRYTLTINKTGTGNGTVAIDPSGSVFSAGTFITLTATPNASSNFAGWSGGVTGTLPIVSLNLSADTIVTATFTLKTYSITATAGAHGSISPNGTIVVNYGASRQFTITAEASYGIAEVKVDGVSVGAVSSYNFPNITANHTIEASFVSLLPEAATLVSPSAKTYTNTPTYVWNAVSNSTQYYVKVNDSDGTKIQQWVTASEAGCSNGTGTCSVTPTAELEAGAGTWWIQTRNSFGDGPLSQGLAFTVSKPEAATLVSPTGKIKDPTPTYTWNAVDGSTKYYLAVNDATGAKIKEWYTAAEAGCPSGTGTCSVTPDTELAIGTVRWWIQTSSPVGLGARSDSLYFILSR